MPNMAPVIIMTVNYSHDIATALLAVSGAAMWLIASHYPAGANSETSQYFTRIYRSITRMAKDSLIWILVAGVPRIYFYTEYEWSPAAGDLQVVAIIIKHIVMFLIVGTGLFYWIKLNKKVKQLTMQQGG
jgi:type IV secretory pathway VirB2 component (pilin)